MGWLILCLALIVIPQIVFAAGTCDDVNHNYENCLAQNQQHPEVCACCVLNKPGGDISSSCGGSNWHPTDTGLKFPNCDKPIGVLITTTGTNLTGFSGYYPLTYIPPSGGPNCDCCNVGVLAKKTPGGGALNDILIQNITVTGWANGILLNHVSPSTRGGLTNSTIVNNIIGIYLLNSGGNTIATNNISFNSKNGVVLDNNQSHETTTNKIYNNIFNNTDNVAFINALTNSWNTPSLQQGINILGILGGNYLGGNYWATPSKKGFSQTCTCSVNGICNTQYTVNPSGPNTDAYPLCIPTVIDVSPSTISGWTLGQGDLTHSGFTITLKSEHKWQIQISDPSGVGHMQSTTTPSRFLTEGLLRGDRSQDSWESIISPLSVESNYYKRYFDLKQEIKVGTDRPGDYGIQLTFTFTDLGA
jgi:parallel beta-helix repeat protein